MGNRTVTVNGVPVRCGVAITKQNGYYVFRFSAGSPSYTGVLWWGTWATSCTPPPGGFYY